ncbi:hypothetical protein Gogos_018621 [Gossypium gossypioides]|uniref:Secreted protein n=1 Tax=Gossypium gossypioides TaxID=34282 RepID=A0A7J9BEL5_GOSGO|nr:hypothetical protein [Gossypium gossypioides]
MLVLLLLPCTMAPRTRALVQQRQFQVERGVWIQGSSCTRRAQHWVPRWEMAELRTGLTLALPIIANRLTLLLMLTLTIKTSFMKFNMEL